MPGPNCGITRALVWPLGDLVEAGDPLYSPHLTREWEDLPPAARIGPPARIYRIYPMYSTH